MYISLDNDQSKMTLGGYDVERFAMPGHKMDFHNLWEKKGMISGHWLIKQEGMTMHNSTTSRVFGANTPTIIDSGTSFILMPLAERNAWISSLEEIMALNVMIEKRSLCGAHGLSLKM